MMVGRSRVHVFVLLLLGVWLVPNSPLHDHFQASTPAVAVTVSSDAAECPSAPAGIQADEAIAEEPPPPAPLTCPSHALGTTWTSLSGTLKAREWQGIATSRVVSGVVAVWTNDEVLISRDHGTTFASLGREKHGVQGVAVGASGDVFVLRHGDGKQDELAIHSTRHGKIVRAVPKAGGAIAMTAGGGYIGIVFHTDPRVKKWEGNQLGALALSRDRGKTWRWYALDQEAVGSGELHIRDDGVISMMVEVPDCSWEFPGYLRGRVGSAKWNFSSDIGRSWGLDHLGRPYDIDGCDGLCRILENNKHMRVKPLPGWKQRPGDSLIMAHNARTTFAVRNGRLIRLRGDRFSIEGPASNSISHLAVDPCGAVFAIEANRILRWTKRHGWRVVAKLGASS